MEIKLAGTLFMHIYFYFFLLITLLLKHRVRQNLSQWLVESVVVCTQVLDLTAQEICVYGV